MEASSNSIDSICSNQDPLGENCSGEQCDPLAIKKLLENFEMVKYSFNIKRKKT